MFIRLIYLWQEGFGISWRNPPNANKPVAWDTVVSDKMKVCGKIQDPQGKNSQDLVIYWIWEGHTKSWIFVPTTCQMVNSNSAKRSYPGQELEKRLSSIFSMSTLQWLRHDAWWTLLVLGTWSYRSFGCCWHLEDIWGSGSRENSVEKVGWAVTSVNAAACRWSEQLCFSIFIPKKSSEISKKA